MFSTAEYYYSEYEKIYLKTFNTQFNQKEAQMFYNLY
jgi:hypothetical protein